MQDGTSPDLDGHLEKEMGGLWANPIKVLDTFLLSVDCGDGWTDLLAADSYATYPYGNSFSYHGLPGDMEVERFQFIPLDEKALVVSYRITGSFPLEEEIGIRFSSRFDLRPSWYSEPAGIVDGKDVLQLNEDYAGAVDGENGWGAVFLSSEKGRFTETSPALLETYGKGCSATFEGKIPVKGGNSYMVSFVIASSEDGIEEALLAGRDILHRQDQLLEEKKAHYASLITRARIEIPDLALQDCYNYAKINTDWLVSDNHGLHYLSAGAKEYPWLFGCDNSYALQGVVCCGDFDLAQRTLTTLKEVSDKENGNGRIIHEMSPFGCIYNYGNTQETAHFIYAVHYVYKWTGDRVWLSGLYPYMKKGIDWLFDTMDHDRNLFPEGYGIMEVQGLNAELIDVAVYSQQALECMAEFAKEFGENANYEKWKAAAIELKKRINDLFWDPDKQMYCDFYGSGSQAAEVSRGAASQYPQNKDYYLSLADEFGHLPKGTMRGFLTNGNWVITTPMETGIAPRERALASLDIIRKEHCSEWGPYLSSLDKDRAMTISTGIQAVSEAEYGRIDQAVEYLDMIAATLGRQLPGSICEMMPDYGCPAQAWTIYGPAKVLIGYIFGIKPSAYEKHVDIIPNFPSDWDHISAEGLRVGNCTFSLSITRKDNGYSCKLKAEKRDFTFTLVQPDGSTEEL
jgi:glycogen debranching enzyme